MTLSKDLLDVVRKEFILEWNGIHGAPHWARVRENGLRLAKVTGANTEVVELFAFLHDLKRLDNGKDPDHGRRAAEFVKTIRHLLGTISDSDIGILVFACAYHSDGLTEGHITVQTCWDADRLDLGRIGRKPEGQYLCTRVAKQPEIIEWAFLRSRKTQDNMSHSGNFQTRIEDGESLSSCG